eukprot:CAMPEP_0174332702 /NCGR_PEP_ID=MMETSP0810-20121108/18514_1 /TAXON_ID=73025 ORGANISM="Eutreptiella gymnastica-like, Strain CCMP1594" /NCGR_SAMPLE_ID=MMETSP0810 /ASSEMBLY_ACC=CAM_ASM_000659 /LENGTH=44 /DNA_ID= /DNA_START= /DNA_END= /DNA_ORIENTATION=
MSGLVSVDSPITQRRARQQDSNFSEEISEQNSLKDWSFTRAGGR